MKKFLLYTFCCLYAGNVFTQVIQWTGKGNSDWHNPCNWSTNTVPACTDSVILPPAFNPPVVTATACFDYLEVKNGAKLQVQDFSLLQEGCPCTPTANPCEVSTFCQTVGGTSNDYAQAVIETAAGEYVIAGYTQSFGAGNFDMYIIKLDAAGNLIWSKTIGGSSWDYAYAVTETSTGDLVVAGYTTSFGAGSYDMYIVKLDAAGNLIWSKTIGGIASEYAYAVTETSTGDLIVAGYTNFVGNGDMYIVKLDASGNMLWGKTIGGTSNDYARAVIETATGEYVIAGYTQSFGAGSYDMYIAQMTASGSILWIKAIGGTSNDYAYAVTETAAGDLVVAGYTTSFGAGIYDMYIVKLNAAGNLLWSKTIGGTSNDYAQAVTETSTGNLVVAGYTSSFGAGSDDMYIVKMDAAGNVIWNKTIGESSGDYAYAVTETAAGDLVVAGYTASFGVGSYDMYIVKLDNSGNLQCNLYCATGSGGTLSSVTSSAGSGGSVNTYSISPSIAGSNTGNGGTVTHSCAPPPPCWSIGGTSADYAYAVTETSTGDLIVAGSTGSFGAGGDDMYIVKLNASGNLLWSKTLGGTSIDYANAVTETSTGDLVVAGYTYSFGAGGYDMYIVKLDASGNLLWSKTIGGTSNDYAQAVTETSTGDLIVAGYTSSFGAGTYDMYIVKLDAAGNLLWSKTIGGSSWDYAYAVTETSTGDLVVAGYTGSFGAGGYDMYIVKLDAAGNVLWSKTIGGTSTDIAFAVTETSTGDYVIAGYTTSFGAGSSDMYIVKLDAAGNLLWNKTIGGTSNDNAYAVTETSTGDLVVAGYTQSFGGGNKDMYIVKLDASGNLLWTRAAGEIAGEELQDITVLSNGDVVGVGNAGLFGGDIIVLKLHDDGTVACTCSEGTTGGALNTPSVTAVTQGPTLNTPSPTLTTPTPTESSGGAVNINCEN